MQFQQETAFEKELALLVAREFPKMRDDLEYRAAIIEKLGWTLALAIALATHGDGKLADETLSGVEGYMADMLSRFCPLAAALCATWPAAPGARS